MSESDLGDHLVGATATFTFGDTLIQQTELDVVDDGAVAEQMERLEHEPDPFRSHCGAPPIRKPGDIDPVEHIPPGCWHVEQTEQ